MVVGSNVRNVAKSAFEAGYKVYAFTDYVDKDLKMFARVERIGENLKERVEEVSQSLNAKVVLCSGYEGLKVKAERFGHFDSVVLDKLRFYRKLERLGLNFPEILSGNDEGKLIKRRFGGGGIGVRFGERAGRDEFFQEFVDGTPFSVTMVVRDGKVHFKAVNRIFCGLKRLNADNFKYCGNMTPFSFEGVERALKIAEELAEVFDVEGCFGVDFILSDDIYVLELNPRFVGSLDTVEMSYGVNLFKAYEKKIDAKPKRTAVRLIYYSPRDMHVDVPLLGYLADVPQGYYRRGEPLVSILSTDLKSAFRRVAEFERTSNI